jgi:hypothetical protein
MRSGFFTKTGRRQEQRIFEQREPALHAVLVFVGANEFLVGELVSVKHVGGDQEGCIA